ncbi:MAG TPA: hypothetical protein VD741_02520, partial [Solirubrobacterales bacterium]|nr:hypothetical protein [Solirubrobacterales bacterium]
DSRNAGLRAGSGPAPGVYRYATRGSESVATDFLSTTHSYDGVSTITVSAGGCGEVERWEVLEERWNEAESCPRSAAGERWTVTEFHEFFGIAQEDAYTCRGESMQRPPFAAPSARFTSRCTSADSSVLNTSRIRGIATVTVGGKKYEAVHTVSSSVVSGDTTGNATSEDWRRRSDGLLLRRSVSSNALTSAGGGARYSERYTIELIDPRPRR